MGSSYYIAVLVAGITGTFFMTAALYLLSAITGKNFKVVGVLATMATNHTTASKGLTHRPADLLLGILLHYGIGVMFSMAYFSLWQNEISSYSFANTMLMGCINGFIATCWWTAFLSLHPNRPAMSPKQYVIAVGISHLLFAAGVWIVYKYFKNELL